MSAPNPTRIYIVGPSSTGKTTLCAALARRLALDPRAHIAEVARGVMRAHPNQFSRATVHTLAMQRAILDAQLQHEHAAEAHGFEVVLSDRSAVDPVVYAALTAQSEEEAVRRQQTLECAPSVAAARGRYCDARACFVLLRPVPGWLVDDGVRSLDDHARCVEVFRRVLAEWGIRYHEIGEEMRDIERRVDAVLAYAGLASVEEHGGSGGDGKLGDSG
jgi:nicotinamide riboside kinase